VSCTPSRRPRARIASASAPKLRRIESTHATHSCSKVRPVARRIERLIAYGMICAE
jgi:hypothetical protein